MFNNNGKVRSKIRVKSKKIPKPNKPFGPIFILLCVSFWLVKNVNKTNINIYYTLNIIIFLNFIKIMSKDTLKEN